MPGSLSPACSGVVAGWGRARIRRMLPWRMTSVRRNRPTTVEPTGRGGRPTAGHQGRRPAGRTARWCTELTTPIGVEDHRAGGLPGADGIGQRRSDQVVAQIVGGCPAHRSCGRSSVCTPRRPVRAGRCVVHGEDAFEVVSSVGRSPQPSREFAYLLRLEIVDRCWSACWLVDLHPVPDHVPGSVVW